MCKMCYVQYVLFSLGALFLHIYIENEKLLYTLKKALLFPCITGNRLGFFYFVIINYILPHCRSPPLYKSSIQKTYKMEEI